MNSVSSLPGKPEPCPNLLHPWIFTADRLCQHHVGLVWFEKHSSSLNATSPHPAICKNLLAQLFFRLNTFQKSGQFRRAAWVRVIRCRPVIFFFPPSAVCVLRLPDSRLDPAALAAPQMWDVSFRRIAARSSRCESLRSPGCVVD